MYCNWGVFTSYVLFLTEELPHFDTFQSPKLLTFWCSLGYKCKHTFYKHTFDINIMVKFAQAVYFF